jgi:hypothetical protein
MADPEDAPTRRPSLDAAKTEEQQSKPQLEETSNQEVTPGELESQKHRTPKSERKSAFWRRHWLAKNARASSTGTERHSTGFGNVEQGDGSDESEDDALESNIDVADLELAAEAVDSMAPKTRQQILIVPQIWLWSLGSKSNNSP